MVTDIEMKGFTGMFSSNREALASGYVLGLLQSNIEMMEGLDPEQVEAVEVLLDEVDKEMKMMRAEEES